MRNLFFVLFVLFGSPAFALELLAPTEVMDVKSLTLVDKVGISTIYRATTLSGGDEGPKTLGIEKFVPGDSGLPLKNLKQKKFVVTQLPGFKSFL